MALEPHLHPELILVLDDCPTRDALFDALCGAVSKHIPGLDSGALKQRLIDREAQGPTSTPEGVAFPHVVAPEIDRTLVVAAKLECRARARDGETATAAGGAAAGVDFGHKEHPPADLIFCMFGPSESPWEHVRLLARLARLVHTEQARQSLRDAANAEEFYQRLLTEDRAHA